MKPTSPPQQCGQQSLVERPLQDLSPTTPRASRVVIWLFLASSVPLCLNSIAAADPPASEAARMQALPDKAFLDALPADIDELHEGSPDGVPASYDWQRRGKRDRWNDPPRDFTAITGWGQVFWARGKTANAVTLQLRNHQTWLCQDRIWRKVQASVPTGGQYRADFAGNASGKPKLMSATDGVLSVQFDAGTAFHFWPSEGRAEMTLRGICGVRVLVEARIVPDRERPPAELLLGLGADYWLNRTSPWDNYKTNHAVGIGRLRVITTEWQWFGFSTAN